MNKWILKMFQLMVGQASPEIRKGVCDMLNDLEKKAKATDNPWDDVIVGLAKAVLDCPDK